MLSNKGKTIVRDISWLSFNGRVLQEANDPSVPLKERIKFLGIFSNNMDEFFRVRVATLKRMIEIQKGKKGRVNMHLEDSPERILQEIQMIVLQQQNEFNRIWNIILDEMAKDRIYLLNETQLNKEQQAFVLNYFEEVVRSGVIPLMLESIPDLPYLRDKSIFLGVVMSKKSNSYDKKYALIEVPTKTAPRFVELPSKPGEHNIILLEDIVRFALPQIFSYFGYDTFSAHIFKVTKDAEIEIDNDISTSIVQKIEKGLKARRKGKPVRFVYDKEMDPGLLEYIVRRLNLTGRDNIIPGGRIHNFRHFMDFPDVFPKAERHKPISHPALQHYKRVTGVVMEKDILLHFPYHSFTPVIDLLREAAMDPEVVQIKITCYRLAPNSKIINALINAVRNRKQVTVMMEVKARFDEEANLEWKEILEEEGVKVLLGVPNMKVHAKCCVIKKRVNGRVIQYGFVSTGNLNERTARFYGDHCLLTANRAIMADINKIFNYLEQPKLRVAQLKQIKTLMVCPTSMRTEIIKNIDGEIKRAREKKKASMIIKLNSLSDEILIEKLYEAARAGVEINMIVRGIFCAYTENKKYKKPFRAISIVDEYLEHSRVMVFHNGGKEKVYISSADWMVRNLDHRVEAGCPILDEAIRQELKDVLQIQLSDNVKARVLDNELSNAYVHAPGKKVRSQIEIHHYLENKLKQQPVALETGGDRHRK